MSSLLEGVELQRRVCAADGLEVHAAQTEQKADVAIIRLVGDASSSARAAFGRIVRHGATGGLEVERADDGVAIASPWPSGTLSHLGSLGWRLTERLSVFLELAGLVVDYHEQDIVVGPFHPDFILLDGEFMPVLLGPGIGPGEGIYAAPEIASSAVADKRSDIFSLGRLLHFVLTGEPPPPPEEDPARLDDLMTYPAGLSRIIRKAVRRNPAQRYASVEAFLADLSKYGRYDEVGLTHPDVVELNFSGVSYRPGATMPPRGSMAPRGSMVPRGSMAPRGSVVPRGSVAPRRSLMPRRSLLPSAVPPPRVSQIAELKPFNLSEPVRFGLLAVGAVGIIGLCVAAYLASSPSGFRAALAVAAGLFGFAVFNPGVDKEATARMVFGVLFAAAMFVANPSPSLSLMGKRSQFDSASTDERTDAVKALVAKGELKYTGVDLSGADLQEQSFFFVKLDGASLEGADLQETQFFRADVSGTNFRDANIAGAIFEGTDVSKALYFDEARCNAATRFPSGWYCESGHPRAGDPSDG